MSNTSSGGISPAQRLSKPVTAAILNVAVSFRLSHVKLHLLATCLFTPAETTLTYAFLRSHFKSQALKCVYPSTTLVCPPTLELHYLSAQLLPNTQSLTPTGPLTSTLNHKGPRIFCLQPLGRCSSLGQLTVVYTYISSSDRYLYSKYKYCTCLVKV